MTDRKLNIAIQALKDIVDPISGIKRTLTLGEQLNGQMAILLSNDPNYLKEIARNALKDTEEP